VAVEPEATRPAGKAVTGKVEKHDGFVIPNQLDRISGHLDLAAAVIETQLRTAAPGAKDQKVSGGRRDPSQQHN